MLNWLKERWREMRGNALWDVTKLIAIPLGYAVIQAIRQQPLHWAVLVTCLIIGVAIVLITRPRFSLSLSPEAQSPPRRATISATFQILPRTARYDNVMEAVKACESVIERNPKTQEISEAEKKLADAVYKCAEIDEWHRFKNPDSVNAIGQLREKITIGREVMERLRKRGY